MKPLALVLLLAACATDAPTQPRPVRLEVRVQRDSVPLVCAYAGGERSDAACRGTP